MSWHPSFNIALDKWFSDNRERAGGHMALMVRGAARGWLSRRSAWAHEIRIFTLDRKLLPKIPWTSLREPGRGGATSGDGEGALFDNQAVGRLRQARLD